MKTVCSDSGIDSLWIIDNEAKFLDLYLCIQEKISLLL